AAFDGKVRIVKYEAKGYGRYIVIRHNNGLETIYGHLSKQLVQENQMVHAGDPIGLGGNTGRSTGSHLHFETRLCGVALNPALMFDFRAQDVVGDYYMFNKRTYEKESIQATRLRGMIGNGSYSEADVRGDAVTPSDSKTDMASINTGATNKQQTTAQPRYHKVKKGETLSSIAKRQGTTVARLCKLNNLSTRSKIRVGQIIRCS
ncbi:MAG: peptidoglycan DD-metalloendopeptidase family protein, partial [Prevotella sp.]|nr:peptidoglycan DD-metalloendopeptidase family protein [Prevotella sp.]